MPLRVNQRNLGRRRYVRPPNKLYEADARP